jgi:NADH:ubiquinone oxidoreductase subunit
MASIGTILKTKLLYSFIGRDEFGNKYYQERRKNNFNKPRRCVIYNGRVEATKVPPMWHAWLHYITDEFPDTSINYEWQQQHTPNVTGTDSAYFPAGHPQSKSHGERHKSVGDYESWIGGQNNGK